MNQWTPPPRPAEYVEQTLVSAILEGTFAPGFTLPGERDLAAQMGVTRPTLRAALQRLEREGWVTIHQGKPTQVNDFWRQGGLSLLDSLVRYSRDLPVGFVHHLLEVRLALAPAYTRAAVERAPAQVQAQLEPYQDLADTPGALASFDWTLHHTLTVASSNPIYTLILNGFAGFYEEMARLYFQRPEARASSRAFYAALLETVLRGDAREAERISRTVMAESITLWERASEKAGSKVSAGCP